MCISQNTHGVSVGGWNGVLLVGQFRHDGAHRDRVRHRLCRGAIQRAGLLAEAGHHACRQSDAVPHTGHLFATFTYSLVALIWTDRGGSGSVPLFSYLLVAILLIISMLAFARLIQSLNNLQLHNVLQVIGARGRAVIRTMFPRIVDTW